MNYGDALVGIQAGQNWQRAGWTSNNAFINLIGVTINWQSVDHPAQYYIPTHPDMLASDWQQVAS